MPASLAAQLDRAARAERRRGAAWGLATLLGAVAGALHSVPAAVVAACVGGCFAGWAARQSAALALARRDLGQGGSPPRRAFVVLLNDPNPRAWRPLLAVWDQAPPADERPPRPDSVWRCDDELDDLLRRPAGGARVHEAWLDTAGRKPRWALADAGLAVVHRRAAFGRFYAGRLMRNDRLGPPAPLTVADPVATPVIEDELPLRGSFPAAVAWRFALVAAVTLGVVLAGG